ncbi:MAG: GNAT family N-acetyltransferase [Bacteroidetes bacterium]|nr:GNAT family N-acetyltransferase [Bacteroidota bacterium]MBL6943577.1 GNAT family N-acetyltransferase [Bacteroidales bacterium]
MKTIIPPVDKQLLKKELVSERFLRNTNNGNNEIYLVSDKDSPNVIREIGRLREVTFRDAGGGTGKELDLDEFDKGKHAFMQLVLWDPQDNELIGGYRYIHCKDLEINDDGTVISPTASLFKYSDKFIKDYFPYTIELGRSFVQPLYQPTFNLRRGMYALDNLWDGIGAVIVDNKDIKYMFGKVTMYTHFDTLARDMILFFLSKYCPDNENLIYPIDPLKIGTSEKILNNIFTGCNYDEDYKTLIQKVRKLGENVPPLINAYMNLSSTMKTFGTAVNHHFGDVEETGILVTVDDIFPGKKDRYLSTHQKQNKTERAS